MFGFIDIKTPFQICKYSGIVKVVINTSYKCSQLPFGGQAASCPWKTPSLMDLSLAIHQVDPNGCAGPPVTMLLSYSYLKLLFLDSIHQCCLHRDGPLFPQETQS